MIELNIDDLTAEKIHSYLNQQEDQKRAAEGVAAERAREERDQLRQKFEKEEVPADALQHMLGMVRKAVERGEKEVIVLHFPSDFLPDSGRSITSGSKEWTQHLSGFAARAYKFYEKELRPRGFTLAASIINFPGGKPGDVGFFLRW
jgi:hypothetical protein